MRRLLLTFTAAISMIAPTAARGQSPGEILSAAVLEVPNDAFGCGQGTSPCDLRLRVYSEADPTDFFGSANPVDGYPRYQPVLARYRGDSQSTGNYPSSTGNFGLSWFSVWDGVLNPGRWDHVGYYGAQSQFVDFAELGNPGSTNCLPVVAQTACFMALWRGLSVDLNAYGPTGRLGRVGGLAPIPRPEVISANPGGLELVWEEATAMTSADGAPDPILGYKLYFAVRDRLDRVGPSALELAALEASSSLLDATPGEIIPRTTTHFTLSASDPLLGAFDPTTQSLVAVIRLVYAANVFSPQFSANSYPAALVSPRDLVSEFSGRFDRDRVLLTWTLNGLAGLGAVNVLRSGRAAGPYDAVVPADIPVNGLESSFYLVDPLDRRLRVRTPSQSLFYRLELIGLDGTRILLDPVEVSIASYRRGGEPR